MKILIINPNTSGEYTQTIDSTAKKYASPKTEITTINPEEGPTFLSDVYQVTIQAPRVAYLVEKNRAKHDAFIIACGADPGLEACRVIAKNVIGIAEAATMTACAVAKRFSFLRVLKSGAPLAWERLRRLGIDGSRCASSRAVGSGVDDEIVTKRHQMLDAYLNVGQTCIDEDGAGALVLNCAGMSDLTEYLTEHLKVPVISGVISAVKIAEQLCSH